MSTHLRRSHSIIVIVALLLLSVVAATVLSAAETTNPKVIRIGFAAVGIGGVQAVGYSSFGSAQMLGLVDEEFNRDGIRIEWNFYRGAGPAVNEAIANGLLDVAWQGDLPSVIGRANGLKTRIVAGAGLRANTYLAVPVDSPAQSLKDLVGKKVALHKGTNLQLTVSRILQAHQLSERDFKSINLDSL
ncbi:MAG TPA: ABC transporter substrate-binding protein, partial [Planctomycetota bacterium]|nr:ABC transporter substrate-binding protein [Planctomycetota bacterium]